MGKYLISIFILFSLISCQKPSLADDYFSREQRIWLKNHSTVRLGFSKGFSPLLIVNSDGSLGGLYPEIYREIEKVSGLKFEIILDSSESVKTMLDQGNIDGILVLSDLSLNELDLRPARSLHQIFPIVYSSVENRKDINSLEDLRGSRIAYQKGSKVELESLIKISGVKLFPMNNLREGILSMLKGDVDYVLGLNIQDSEIIKDSIQGVRIAYFDLESIYSLSTGIRSDWPELIHIINRSMDIIGRKKLNSILHKWIQPTFVERHAIFTPQENEWIDNNQSLTVASDPFWSPIEFFSDNGEFEGIAIDIMDEVTSISGLTFNYIEDKSWKELIDLGRNKEVDMFSCLSKTDSREEFLDFTTPYLDIPITIFTRSDINYISGLSVLDGERIGVVRGFAIEEWLRSDHPELKIVTVNDTIDGLKKLESGDIFAFIGSRVTTSWYKREYGFDLIKEAGVTPYSNKLSMGVRKDLKFLLSILEKSLRVLGTNRVSEITESWLDKVEEKPIISFKEIIIILQGALLFLSWSLGVFYILILKKRVNKLTSSHDIQTGTKNNIGNVSDSDIVPDFKEVIPSSDKVDYLKGMDIWHSKSSYFNGLKQFALEHNDIVKDIQLLIKQGKLKEAKETSNTLKLMSGNLALIKVNSLAGKVELILKSGSVANLDSTVKDLEEEVQSAVEVIYKWCGDEV